MHVLYTCYYNDYYYLYAHVFETETLLLNVVVSSSPVSVRRVRGYSF